MPVDTQVEWLEQINVVVWDVHLQDFVAFKESVHTVTHVTFKDIKDRKGNLIRSR